MDKINSARNTNVYAFFDYLASKDMLPYINSLKQKATKKKPFSFERLTFVMLPLFKHLESQIAVGNEKIKNAINQWFSVVHQQPNINLSTKFDA